jgi:molybdopterin/thiamine biosynthesis adenylyltransferase
VDLSKSFEYFDPTDVDGKCHIIGCGSVGSTIAENLARLGVTKFVLYDFDTVEPHNIANQMFTARDIKMPKVEATKRLITDINPDAKDTVEIVPEGYTGQKLNGYVFLCVDNIDLRREICAKNKMNRSIKVVFDCRTRLEDAQTYAAEWGDLKQVNNLIKSMEFSHEEAHAATPTSACGRVLGVAPTVRMVCCLCVCNFMNYILGKGVKPLLVCNPFEMEIY